MTKDIWLKISQRIIADQPNEIDDVMFDPEPNGAKKGRDLSRDNPATWVPPAKSNWPMNEPDRAAIGVRVLKQVTDPVAIATRLVAMATERKVTPVIFSAIAVSGFERFGFRVERLAGADQRQLEMCEEELKQFWDIAIVVDAQDILAMR